MGEKYYGKVGIKVFWRKQECMCRKKYIVAIMIVLSMVMLLLGCGKKKNNGNSSSIVENNSQISEKEDDWEISEDPLVDASDAEEYYEEYSEVVEVTDAKESQKVLTEKETSKSLEKRGFIQFPISSSYSMNGEYYDEEEIESTGSEKHPIYETYYMTEGGDIWTIFMINGMIMANPVSYNLQSTLNAQVMISEAETIMSYDSTTNQFFETIPDESALIVVNIGKIDAKTLESLTLEEIDEYIKEK